MEQVRPRIRREELVKYFRNELESTPEYQRSLRNCVAQINSSSTLSNFALGTFVMLKTLQLSNWMGFNDDLFLGLVIPIAAGYLTMRVAKPYVFKFWDNHYTNNFLRKTDELIERRTENEIERQDNIIIFGNARYKQ